MDTEELDAMIATLQANKDRWAKLDLETKIAMGRRLMTRIHAIGPRWVEAAKKAKRIPGDSPLVGEEWLGGPMTTLRTLRLTLESLEQVARGRKPQLKPGAVRTREGGQVVVEVFPHEAYDKLLFSGFTAEVWMDPALKPHELHETMAVFYDQVDPPGHVALVLGAGNVASIPPLDTLYKLYAEGQVVLLKMNPVNDYLGPFFEDAFAEYIDEGYMAVCYGGVEVGKYLTHHADIDEIHITGSDRTHDAIVYGVGEDGERRKGSDDRLVDKRITSELGNVSPVIVVPGEWSASDLRFHAENLATQLANNGGFNCNAVRVIITHASWPQRGEFLNAFRRMLEQIPQRHPYYPGARERFDTFAESHPDKVETYGKRNDELMPWGFIPSVDDADHDNMVFTTESWCGITAETPIEAKGVEDFLEAAVAFCNEHVWGTLNAGIVIDPRTQAQHSDALERAVADLAYGTVVINHWAALAYGMGVTTWGAFPGHTFDDIQSGIGVVHNALLFDRPQKTVIRGPFKIWPRPPWFVTNRQTHAIAPRLADYEYEPSIRNVLRIVSRAVRG